ncbi:hypothetical protein CYMTET_19994 [Cymbomonas tetramitiformis]|uniref:Uncharacterized protein n=1 Tax=Cymbomonas tetramitiformis TaxID=36881 RepID=A0AAE0G686_9CHLO|nr:hypothetical protein CYMTET_19994 [Cymbomonas tetramitiformis]
MARPSSAPVSRRGESSPDSMNSSPPHFSERKFAATPPADLADSSFRGDAVPQMVADVPRDVVDLAGQPAARSREALAAHRSGSSSVKMPAAHLPA